MSEAALYRPMPLRVLLDETARWTRRHFREMYVPVVVPLALAGGLFSLSQTVLTPALRSGQFTTSLLLFIAVAFGFGLFTAFAYASFVAAAVDAVAGRPVSMARSWKMLIRPRALGTVLLSGLLCVLGIFCCVAPGIYLGLLYSLVIPAMVEDGVYGMKALNRSSDLVRYNPARDVLHDPRIKVFVIGLVGWLIGYVVNMAIQLPAMGVQQFLLFRDMASGHRGDPRAFMARMAWIQVPTTMLTVCTQAVVRLYTAFGLALLFFDLRRRREGSDLEAAFVALSGLPLEAALPAPHPAPAP